LNALNTSNSNAWFIPLETGVTFPAVVTQQRLIVQDDAGTLLAFSTYQGGSPTADEPVQNAESTADVAEPTATWVPTLVPSPTPTPVS
jgi:hypothetical protein